MIKVIHIYDCDGVLVDSSHRYRTLANGQIDLDYWYANRTEEKMKKDIILPFAKRYLTDCLNPSVYTILCTSRFYHPLDIAFIIGRLGAPDKLIMRPIGNHEPDWTLKVKQLQFLFNLTQFRGLHKRFWDDNIRTVYAIADMGIESNLINFTGSHA